jgi:phospholipid N-methyltransferase
VNLIETFKNFVLNQIFLFLRDLRKTGAIAPSSRFLADDITELLRLEISEKNKPLRILEIGPGTGTLTKAIVASLRTEDQLDLVELNPHFTRLLRRKYSADNINVFYGDFIEYQPSASYDYIFSSIPYETIPEQISEIIWRKKLSVCSKGGKISYYKYLNFNHFRCKLEKKLVKEHCINEKLVFLNLPPAKLFTLQVNAPLPVEIFAESQIPA